MSQTGGILTLSSARRSARLPLHETLAVMGAMALVAFWILAPAGGFDVRNYWLLDLSYTRTWHEPGSFVYSPAAAQAIAPFTLLPFAVFAKLVLAINLVCLVWLIGPFWGALALAALPVQSELLTGQIHLPMAVLIVLGVRHAGVWAPMLLTKVTPGVGLLWFLTRREWRPFFVALGITAAIVVVSVVIDPGAWGRWFAFLRTPFPPPDYILIDYPVVPRLIVAALLVVLAASRNRPGALPLIVLLALPAVWFTASVVALAVPRLARSSVAAPNGTVIDVIAEKFVRVRASRSRKPTPVPS
jgi:hypothetical protein